MFNVEKLLGQMLAGGVTQGHSRRKSSLIPGVSKAQLGVGVIGLAMAAWEHYKGQQSATAPAAGAAMPPPPPPAPGQLPAAAAPPPPPPQARSEESPSDRSADASHLIRSMIAAANADGQIDAQERSAILERALEAGLDPATQQFLMGELRAPATLEQIVAATRPALKLETYAAAMIAITVDTDAERQYLDRLAGALGLTSEDRERVHQQLQLG
ncbi:MAG: tellurite resistance TerB family protein [Lysobacterales bacterium]